MEPRPHGPNAASMICKLYFVAVGAKHAMTSTEVCPLFANSGLGRFQLWTAQSGFAFPGLPASLLFGDPLGN